MSSKIKEKVLIKFPFKVSSLTILGISLDKEDFSKYRNKSPVVICQCDCGNICRHSIGAVLDLQRRGCGCQYSKKTHNSSRTRIYTIWQDMKSRCYKKSSDSYYRYGARGIKVCDEWLGKDGCKNFVKWAYSNGYNDSLTIDRETDEDNYCPEKCSWITPKENSRKRSTSKYFTYRGVTACLSALVEQFGGDIVTYSAAKYRAAKGWSIDEIMTRPMQPWSTGGDKNANSR